MPPRVTPDEEPEVKVVADVAEVLRDRRGELFTRRDLVVVAMREMIAKSGNHSVRHVRDDVMGLQLLRDSIDQRTTFCIIDQPRLALLRGEEFIWRRYGMDLEMKNAMRFGGVDLHRDAGKL